MGMKCFLSRDLVFIQDTTESQQPYINNAVTRCKHICTALQDSGQFHPVEGLRLALIAFRDYFDADQYVTKDFNGFTDDVHTFLQNLSTLQAEGGGDGPEAVTAALDKASKLKWRDDAAKIAILITDAPPHGIGEQGDYYSDGEPSMGMLQPSV